ncbi:MAG: T9SS type A sorting domain-containing protein, partial [Bacteroidia bacterium]|nr:T9SS type A sorting domain-containing protein [Bacteroidia bacterium]
YFGNDFFASNTGAAFDPSGGTSVFDRGSKGEIDVDANDNFYHVELSKTSTAWSAQPLDDGSVYGYIKINGNLTITTGTWSMVSDVNDYVALDLNGNLTISANGTFNAGNSSNHTVSGNWTNSAGTFLSGTGTITFDGTSTIITGGITDDKDFYNVILNGTSATLSTNHIDIDNDFTITNGTWNIYSGGFYYDMYVFGNWINNATFNCAGSGLVTFDDFTDGEYTTNPAWTVQSCCFTVTGGVLLGTDDYNNERISVPSNQVYGEWEFQYSFDVATTNAYVRYFIIMTPDNPDPNGATTDGYYVWVDGGLTVGARFRLIRMDNGASTTLITADWTPGTAVHTVKVTRNVNNGFELFLDAGSKGTATDATYTSSSYMGIWTTGNLALDNHEIDNIKCLGIGGTVTLDGSSTQDIQGTSITNYNNLTINNSIPTVDGGIVMEQSIRVYATLLMTDGAIDMGSYNISLGTSGTLSGETNDTRIYTSAAGTGEISTTRILNAPAGVNVAGLGAVLTDAANLGATTIERGHKAQSIDGYTSTKRYYDITSGTPTSATFKFYFFDKELNGQTPSANMKLRKSTDGGTTWTNEGGTWTDGTPDDDVTLTGITGFSRWTVSDKLIPLPIELLYFNAKCDNDNVIIYWTTATETNNNYFTLEKSYDAEDWKILGTIPGAGNSNSVLNYQFYDQPETGNRKQIYYRLKQTDYDGRYEYFSPIAVSCASENSDAVNAAYYDYNNNTIFISFKGEPGEKYRILLYDITGRLLLSEQHITSESFDKAMISCPQLSPGVYNVVITFSKGIFTKRIDLIR